MTELDLASLLLKADGASPAERIGHRDPIAAHGAAAISPMLDWIAKDRHAYFAVRVIEAVGQEHRDNARAALEGLTAADPGVVAYARAAAARVAPSRSAIFRATRTTGGT